MKKGNLALAAFSVVVGAIIIAIASSYPSAADYGTGVPGPGLWPIVISAFMLTLGILLVLVGAFLLWRRIVDRMNVLKEKKRLSIVKLGHCLDELGQWREQFHRADETFADLVKALSVFES